MRRQEFIAFVSGSDLAVPLASRARQPHLVPALPAATSSKEHPGAPDQSKKK